ncbi:DUF748 domain-containing protein [Maribacter sp. 2307UL18-2]|uniref:DUF748 domain-containing protein n=1 Tax=Maribacter sp. 2307UL18-2 TaxID=3386274 RepID=UPI0039BC6B88
MKISTAFRSKNFRWRVFGIVFALVLFFFAVQVYVEHRIEVSIADKLPEHVLLDYADLDVNLFLGNLSFQDANLLLLHKDSKKTKAKIETKAFEINGLDYVTLWNKKSFLSEKVLLKNGKLSVFKKYSDSLEFSVSNIALELDSFQTDALQLKKKIPFNYGVIKLSLNDLFLNLSQFEILKIKKLTLDKEALRADVLSIVSKFSKTELSKKLSAERDHVNLNVSNMTGIAAGLEVVNDSLQIHAEELKLEDVELLLYRDKTLADDTSTKRMYGGLLRKLPIRLNVDSVLIENGRVSYAEKVGHTIKPSSILFDKLNASILNLSNINLGTTKLKATANLMGVAPIELKSSFQSRNAGTVFQASVVLKDLETTAINPFMESNANVRVDGHVNELYLTVNGNEMKSSGDMKMKYENFKFSVLDKDRLGINKTLTAIVNIFTNDGSKTDEKGYRYGKIEVERDHTKSFFNYLWLNAKDGLKNTVVGNGKKED